MLRMNRETSAFHSSDTLVVVDRSRRKRMALIAGAVGIVVVLLVAFFLMRGGDEATNAAGGPGAGAGGRGGQIPAVTVIVPGQTQVARTITASGALAARRDQPIGISGQGGRVTRVLVDAGHWRAVARSHQAFQASTGTRACSNSQRRTSSLLQPSPASRRATNGATTTATRPS